MSLPTHTTQCHPVAEARWFLERFAFLERRCLETLAAWIWTSDNLDCKLIFGAHAYEDATHVELFQQRTGELHSGLPVYGWEPRPLDLASLDLVYREALQASTLEQKLSWLYAVLKPWLLRQYEAFYGSADPILEAPTRRLLEQVMGDKRAQIAWGEPFLRGRLGQAALEAQHATQAWQTRFEQRLQQAWDALQLDTTVSATHDPLLRLTGAQPASDPRMHLIYYTPGQGSSEEVDFDPQNETEIQQIMLSTLVSVEVEAAELLARILLEFPELPWPMRLQLARQMWDECRHAASQWRTLRQSGAELGTWPAITYINLLAGDEPDVFKRLIVLQRVVEGISVDQHRPRARGFQRQGDQALVEMFDYILADEDTHIALSRWITRLVGDDQVRLQELASYQATREQAYADYSTWLISKRRDLARLYASPPGRTAATPGKE